MSDVFRKEVRFSGSGGQGLILDGIVLARAGVLDKFKVTQTQSYGPESRGGSSRADTIISEGDIFYPEAQNIDILIALTQTACDKFIYEMKEDGVLIVDNNLVKNISVSIGKIYEEPFTEITLEKLGTELPTNIVVLSFMVKITKLVTEKSLEQAICDSVKPMHKELNIKAMNLGFEIAKKYL
ncbi:MAG: 2-oxoacid:acceptor oxidoreductase family protein [Candidatus Cloacimonetes bacterium]|nr:2-oxoacid:acceptor oxidoreductase family protein [Candidatus Cloacimonadota bacterium]MDD2650317.1 2-oxoacid:acceptor oxidoreductase family protein [Candidatus Cloacimonadota bacterium]MDD3500888.1 2-oxoacid:acceptor oxidoreductase family protein [Candidatus Cloacimonadota bacterium]